jgi:hypothetical protein
MIADSLSVEVQMSEKMLSLNRMTQFVRGIKPKNLDQRFAQHIKVTEYDTYSSMLGVLPEILRFSIICLSHKFEIVKMSALKLIKHVLETQGCSLDFGLVFILKGMLRTFPAQQGKRQECLFDLGKLFDKDITISEFLFGLKIAEPITPEPTTCQREDPASGFKRALSSTYQHVLDTFVSVLSSVSSHILHSIFYEVIEPTILCQSTPVEVKIFTCKIAEKIITICQGDLLISSVLLDTLLGFVTD